MEIVIVSIIASICLALMFAYKQAFKEEEKRANTAETYYTEERAARKREKIDFEERIGDLLKEKCSQSAKFRCKIDEQFEYITRLEQATGKKLIRAQEWVVEDIEE